MNIKNLLVGGAMAIAALAATTAANATVVMFTISDGTGTLVSGDFTTNALNEVIAVVGNMTSGGAVNFTPIGPIDPFVPNPNGAAPTLSPSTAFIYDDVFSMTPGTYGFDNSGLLFTIAGVEYNLFSNGPGYSNYTLYNFNNGQYTADNVTFFSSVPEPATWAMMILGIGLLGAGLRLGSGKPERAIA